MRQAKILMSVVLGAAALLLAASANASTLQFTVIGIDCKECAPPIVKALEGIGGVENVTLTEPEPMYRP